MILELTISRGLGIRIDGHAPGGYRVTLTDGTVKEIKEEDEDS